MFSRFFAQDLSFNQKLLLVFISAAILSIAGRPWGLPYLAWFGFIPIIHVLAKEKNLFHSAIFGYISALPLMIIVFECLWPIRPWLFPIVVLSQCLYYAIVGSLMSVVTKKFGSNLSIWCFPIFWIAMESLLSSKLLFAKLANPASIAFSQADTPLSLLASLSGPTAVSFALLLVNICIYKSLQKQSIFSFITFILIILLFVFCIPLKPRKDKSIKIAIIQGKISNIETLFGKFDKNIQKEILDRNRFLSEQAKNAGAELLIWPESSIPQYIYNDQPDDLIINTVNDLPYVITGGFRYVDGRDYNSAFLLKNSLFRVIYDKMAPAPLFEDYITPGKSTKPIDIKGINFGILICWDSLLFELGQQSVKNGAEVITVLTNDTFAGNTSAAWYHLQTSKLLSKAIARPIIHASQSGPSVIIDQSEIQAFIDKNQSRFAIAKVFSTNQLTIFGLFGNWFGFICCFFASFLLFICFTPTRMWSKFRFTKQ